MSSASTYIIPSPCQVYSHCTVSFSKMYYPIITKAGNLHWMVLLKCAAVFQTCDTAIYHFSIGNFVYSHNEKRVCLITHNQSLKSTSICIQDILELAACNKVSTTSYISSCATVWNCMTCKRQRHKISPCHCSKLNKDEFWKLTHSTGAPFIKPSSIRLHLKLSPNMSLKFFIDIILPATPWPWDWLSL
jgi:hypothetical protein